DDEVDVTRRERAILATESSGPPYWKSVMSVCEERDGGVSLLARDAEAIGASIGDAVMMLPIRPHRQPRSSRSSTTTNSSSRSA
ncbi:MAG: hypothetical protein ACHREM_17595, partial [Polyangiales bacterium]